MSKPFEINSRRNRDGTSQVSRGQRALSPDYVSIDERSLEDLLAFTREYAKELNYYDENNQAKGVWSTFLDPDLDPALVSASDRHLELAAAYARDPEKMSPAIARAFSRPHFALFLSFLQLLGKTQEQLNGFTQRHLEFYYQKILGMTKKTAVADCVNVLLRPTPRVTAVEVPAGHLLSAGRDADGRDRFYRTDRRILVNHAQISRLSAVYADRRVTGIRQAREQFEGTRKEAFLTMLAVALGEPLPGDVLPEYTAGTSIDFEVLSQLHLLVQFCQDQLFMELFELRSLMDLKHQRDHADAEWEDINKQLEAVGRTRSGNTGFKLEPADPRDFDANLEKALGREPNFAGLTQVENIDDLYHERTRKEVKNFILSFDPENPTTPTSDGLFFTKIEDFVSMMQIKVRIDNEWKEINRILELAGQRKRDNTAYRLLPEGGVGFAPTDFATNFTAALDYADAPPVDFGLVDFSFQGVANIGEYYHALHAVENYFFMSAENYAHIMSVAIKPKSATQTSEWEQVYDMLAAAYRDKVYQQRRAQLKRVREEADELVKGFTDMLHYALDEDPTQAEAAPLERLREYVATTTDYDFLKAIADLQAGDDEVIDWGRVYRIVELAQRNYQHLPEPVARIHRWINLHAHEDATTNPVDPDNPDPDNPRWKTFCGPLPTGEEAPPAVMGWAIGSPLLLLSAGQRQVVLTLGFDKDGYDAEKIKALFPEGPIESGPLVNDLAAGGVDHGPFHVQVSSGENWFSPDSVEIKIGEYPSLSGVTAASARELTGVQFILRFSEQLDSIAAPLGEATGMTCDWPVLRLMLRQYRDKAGQYITHYAPFENLRLVHTHVEVQVGNKDSDEPSGLSEILIQNDQAVLDASKPFQPFSANPVVGSRFYLGHAELVHKRLDSLHFGIEWMGGPVDLSDHYKNYKAEDFVWNFTTRIRLIDKRVAYELVNAATLFDVDTIDNVQIYNASKAHNIDITDVSAALKKAKPGYRYRRSLDSPAGADLLNWSRYLQWELSPLDFQHQVYPSVSSRKSVEMAAAISSDKTISADDYQVSPPYTPKIKLLDLHYTASLELDLSVYTPNQAHDQVFHIHPFGYNEAQPQAGGGCWFLPKYSAEGELYIGITGAAPPQNISVLFQMAEGSANPERTPVAIDWSYLSGDRWHSLADGGIRLDTTRGLINSGIIEFELRHADPSTRLPPGYYWLRASIPYHSDSVCDTVAIQAQAISATLLGNDYATDHYNQPLPGDSITGLSPAIPGIAEVLQPYTSFGGKPPEQDAIFYTRVSERLRHKQRALTVWDYERLVLERFAQIYKVKCQPADAAANPDAVGQLSLIVIPDIRNRLPFDPFGPKAPADLIKDIEVYLADKMPPYARVEVRNAHFVPVKVRVGVRFRTGYDVGFYKERLIEDLNRFLSPWAFDEGADIVIGDRIYANSIVNFLDQREYVDYVAAIKLFSSEDGRTFKLALAQGDQEGYYVSTSLVGGVLVAARSHEIDIIEDRGYTDDLFTGINFMKVELDFVVG